MCDTTKRWPNDKVKENCETNLKVYCIMQLSLSHKVLIASPEYHVIASYKINHAMHFKQQQLLINACSYEVAT